MNKVEHKEGLLIINCICGNNTVRIPVNQITEVINRGEHGTDITYLSNGIATMVITSTHISDIAYHTYFARFPRKDKCA